MNPLPASDPDPRPAVKLRHTRGHTSRYVGSRLAPHALPQAGASRPQTPPPPCGGERMHYAELNKAWAELTAPGAPMEVTRSRSAASPLRTYKNAPPNVRALWLSSAQFAEREYLVSRTSGSPTREAHQLVASDRQLAAEPGACSRATGSRSPCATIPSGC